MYEAANFIALNKLRGFTPRQQRLLELEAVYHSTQYHGLPPWEQEVSEDGQRVLCGHEREPRIKAGLIEEKVETIIDMLVGEGRFPDITIEGDKDLTAKIEEVRLSKRIRGPARDLVVKGSGPLEVGVLDGERLEAKHLRPEWCEPIFVAKVGRPRARDLVAELAKLGVALPAPRDAREYLWTPDGAQSEDLAFLRYEYVFHDEEVASSATGARKTSWRHRIDFTPTLTVYYEDQVTYESTTQAAEWKVAEVLQHNWGVVPVAWARTPDAEDGEPEGPSLITESLRSISEAADRALTRKDASVSVVANPKPYTVDLEDQVANINVARGMPSGWRANSSEILNFQSAEGKEGKIGLLEPTGKGPEAAKAHYEDLRDEAARVSRVLAHDPQRAAGVQSGESYKRMMEPTIQRVGSMRIAVGELLEDFVRIAAAVLGRPRPKVKVTWPPIVRPTATDMTATSQALSTATGGSAFLSQESAVRIFATHAEVDDVEAEVKAVAKDAEEAMRQARETLAAGAKAEPGADDPDADE